MTKKLLWDVHYYYTPEPFIFTPGIRTPEEFVEFCRTWDDGFSIDPKVVRHTYARWIPVWENGKYEGLFLDIDVPKKRGAFLITCAEEFDDLRVID